MTAAEAATQKATAYIRSGMAPREAIRRACKEVCDAALAGGVGDFAEGWETFTTYAPWIAAGIAGIFLYRTGVKAKRAATDYIEQKRRKFAAAKAVWDATL